MLRLFSGEHEGSGTLPGEGLPVVAAKIREKPKCSSQEGEGRHLMARQGVIAAGPV